MNYIDDISITLQMMKIDKFIPKSNDFIYLLSKLRTYDEAKWLMEEFESLGKKPTQKMYFFMIPFTRTIAECLELKEVIKSRRYLSTIYLYLITLSENIEEASLYLDEARKQGIDLSDLVLNKVGNMEIILTDFSSFKEALATYKLIYDGTSKLNKLDNKQILKFAKKSSKTPKTITTRSRNFQRNGFVTLLAKRLANGYCQLCDNQAPFLDKYGNPYLETHHIEWLSRGGNDTIENTIALCPNCHKKIHVLDSHVDINKLLTRNIELIKDL